MRRRAAILSLAAGLGVIALAQYASPLASPPLYDGVVPQEPYRYIVPSTGQAGSPTSYHGSVPVTGTASPPFVAATTESPPQAQLIVGPGAFVLPPGVTSLTVSIEPMAPATDPPGAGILGNVYRVSVTDQAGAALSIDAATMPTISLRAPDGVSEASISQLLGGVWAALPTGQGGQPGVFLASVSSLGDFAVTAQDQGPFGLDSTILLLGGATTLLCAASIGGVLLLRRSRASRVIVAAPAVRRTASKRRRGKRRRGGTR